MNADAIVSTEAAAGVPGVGGGEMGSGGSCTTESLTTGVNQISPGCQKNVVNKLF